MSLLTVICPAVTEFLTDKPRPRLVGDVLLIGLISRYDQESLTASQTRWDQRCWRVMWQWTRIERQWGAWPHSQPLCTIMVYNTM